MESSESLPQRNVQHVTPFESARGQFATIELEPHVDADGADRRSITKAESGRATQLSQVQIPGAKKDVARVEEPDGA